MSATSCGHALDSVARNVYVRGQNGRSHGKLRRGCDARHLAHIAGTGHCHVCAGTGSDVVGETELHAKLRGPLKDALALNASRFRADA